MRTTSAVLMGSSTTFTRFTGRRNNSFDSTEAGASTTSSSDSSREDSSDVINGHYVNKEDTLIIFDWDDTIFPTRYLTVQWVVVVVVVVPSLSQLPPHC